MSAGKPILYLHPGLPKAASSFLTARVFSQLRSVGWSVNDRAVVAAARAIAYPKENTSGASLADAIHATQRSRSLMSYDALCGNPYGSFEDRVEILRRLEQACDGVSVRVLLLVRRQAEWIESIFKQSLHEYYYTPFSRFVVWSAGTDKSQRFPSVVVDRLDWGALAEGFVKTFGKSNVMVLPYESLSQDVTGFIGRLSGFLGAPLTVPENSERVNRGYGDMSCRIALMLNPLLREKSPYGFLPNRPFFYALKARRHLPIYGRLFRLSSRLSVRSALQGVVDRHFWSPAHLLTPDEKVRVMARCSEGNRRLASLTGLDLAGLGYFETASGPPG